MFTWKLILITVIAPPSPENVKMQLETNPFYTRESCEITGELVKATAPDTEAIEIEYMCVRGEKPIED